MSNSLQDLAEPQTRNVLLLAEAAAWLHDMGKCDERLLQKEAKMPLGKELPKEAKDYKYKKAHSYLLGSQYFTLLNESITLKELIEEGRPENQYKVGKPWLVRTLGYCHNVAHMEKEEEAYYLLKQIFDDTRQSDPFGSESEPLVGLQAKLRRLPFNQLSSRSKFKPAVEEAFSSACGDTRRPLNDVTLWDWSSIVAAFYKAALASAVLGYKKDPPNLYWRLLSIRFNGAGFSERVARVPDLLVRQKLLGDGLDRVRTLLEETYPLGTEIYRDEDGSVFIVPGIEDNLLSLRDKDDKTLSTLILHEFSTGTINAEPTLQLDSEITPTLKLDEKPWHWQDPSSLPDPYSHQGPLAIAEHVGKVSSSSADANTVRDWWEEHKEDICTVCQLRPQGWGTVDNKVHYDRQNKGMECPSRPTCQTCKALKRKVCAICEQRRENRSQQWAEEQERKTTIWIDEVANADGRLALVIGKFDLECWLDGTMLFYPSSWGGGGKKAPSRLVLKTKSMGAALTEGSILKIQVDEFRWNDAQGSFERRERSKQRLAPIQRQEVSVIGDGKQVETSSEKAAQLIAEQALHSDYLVVEQATGLYTMEEAQTPARLYRVWETTRQFWQYLQDELCSEANSILGKVSPRLQIQAAFEPRTGLHERLDHFHTYEMKLGNVNLSVTCIPNGEFITVDNLQRTATLLGLLDGSDKDYSTAASYIQKELQNKVFEVEEPTGYGSSNKPLGTLHILDVTFDCTPYTPAIPILAEPRTFMAIVPADKALQVMKVIKEKYEKEMGKVRNRLSLTTGIVFADRRTPLPAILDAGRRILQQPVTHKQWKVKHCEKTAAPPNSGPWPSNVELTLEKDRHILRMKVQTVIGDGKTPDEWYPYWYMKAPISDQWVLASDLGEGNIVSLAPSRFDFEFLDTAARRFEISYENDKRRGTTHPTRPYYLEQLDDFEKLWTILSENLETTQIHNLMSLIETKRVEWAKDQCNDVFNQHVRDILNNANWNPRPDTEQFDQLLQAAISGQLADVVELYMRILKKGDQKSTEQP